MKFLLKQLTIRQLIAPTLLVLTLFGAIGYSYYSLQTDYRNLDTETQNEMNSLQGILLHTRQQNENLQTLLRAEQEKSNSFSSELTQIQGTVGSLVKLSQIDPELLKKYSRVYFLNENYVPAHLTQIPSTYLYEPKRTMQFSADIFPFLQRLVDAAQKDNVPIKIASAYRSFNEQSALKASYKVTYGSGANRFSADQGYSEHQLGSTVDFTTPKIGGNLVGFEKTDAYTWLQNNAYKYGFILSYPEGNDYYQFEPWHWRFVGIFLATTLHDNNKRFYDLDQRTIDPYLITLFDMQ